MIKCKLVTQNQLVYEGEVESLVIPAADGEMGILTDHIPFIALLAKGRLLLTLEKDKTKEFEIEGGLAEMRSNDISILTDKANEIEILESSQQ